jgi:hypothetical protein
LVSILEGCHDPRRIADNTVNTIFVRTLKAAVYVMKINRRAKQMYLPVIEIKIFDVKFEAKVLSKV